MALTAKTIYIIRHGETDYNKQGIVQGRGVNSDLNEDGKKQALLFYKAYRHIPFDAVYTSTLKRTHQTVAPFLEAGLQEKWTQLVGLDELDWGIYEGKESTPQLRSDFKQVLSRWGNGDLNHKTPNGESPLEVKERQEEAIRSILEQEAHQDILICTHGRAMRILLCHLLGKSVSEMDTFPHTNLTLYRLSYDNGVFTLLDFNNRDHLHSF